MDDVAVERDAHQLQTLDAQDLLEPVLAAVHDFLVERAVVDGEVSAGAVLLLVVEQKPVHGQMASDLTLCLCASRSERCLIIVIFFFE